MKKVHYANFGVSDNTDAPDFVFKWRLNGV